MWKILVLKGFFKHMPDIEILIPNTEDQFLALILVSFAYRRSSIGNVIATNLLDWFTV